MPTSTTVFFSLLVIVPGRRNRANLNFVPFNDVNLPKLPYIIGGKTQTHENEGPMGRLLKWLFYLAILAVFGLIAYAYVGPFLGADFSAPATPISQEVILHVE